jgi:hypothetical protein
MAQSTQYDQAYGAQGKPIQNVQPGPVIATRDPTSTDLNYKLGREWINKSTPSIWYLGSKTTSVATWIAAGSGTSGGVVTLTGDSGGAISPLAGNITVVGDSADGMSVVGTANTLTVNASAASTTQRGTMETSTDAESVTGTSAVVAVTPASLTARLAAPGAIGGTTPAAATFTTLTTVGTASINASGAGVTTIGTGGTGATNIGNATGNTAVTGSLSTTTSLSATTTVTAGTDLVSTAGNVLIQGAAKQLRVEGGAVTDFIGSGTLTNGVATIANTNISADDRIFIQRTAANASTLLGELKYSISAATSFTVTSLEPGTPADTEVNDQSSFVYFIVRQL